MKKRVIIIDDDIEIVNLLKLALENKDFEIVSCLNFEEVKKLVNTDIIGDVILLDYFMPQVDGLSIAKYLYEKGIKIPIIFFTASDAEIENYPPNVVDSLKKPFGIDELITSLNRIIKIKNLFSFSILNISQDFTKKNKINSFSPEIQDIIFTEKAVTFKLLLNKLSHNIKNSLQTIINYIELLEKGYVDDINKVRFFQTIRKKADEIKESLEILKKPENGIIEENFSLKNAIRKVLEDLKGELKKREIYVKTNFQKNLPLYYGYRWNFISFFNNLLSKTIPCIEKKGKLTIDLFSHHQEYIIDIKFENVSTFCENKLRFFDPSQNNLDDLELTKAILMLKDMGGKIVIEEENDYIIFHIQLPMRCINV